MPTTPELDLAPVTSEMRRITDGFYLAFTLWREARNEQTEGKVALVYSIMDRVKNPKWWGRDVPSVVTKRLQYSSLTYPKDPQLVLYPVYDSTWNACLRVALDVLDGVVTNPVPGADSYYATYIAPPAWAKPSQFVAQIGGHRFYNTDGNHPDNTKET